MKNAFKMMAVVLTLGVMVFGNVNITKADINLYNKALDYASSLDFIEAEKSFKSFVTSYPRHKKHKDAQYWLGRVYFAQKKYEEAAITLAEFNSQYPNDSRFQETTLFIAESAMYFAPKVQLCDILSQSLEFMINPSVKFVERINFLKSQKNCNDNKSNQNVIASKSKNINPPITSAELEQEKQNIKSFQKKQDDGINKIIFPIKDTKPKKYRLSWKDTRDEEKLTRSKTWSDTKKINLAKNGNIDLQYIMSKGFLSTYVNEEERIHWLLKAANNGHPDAINYLAMWIGIGKKGFKKDIALSKSVKSKLSKRYITNYLTNYEICTKSVKPFGLDMFFENGSLKNFYIKLNLEAERRGLDCGVKDNNKTIIASKPETKIYIQPKSTISSAELKAERNKRLQLERELAEIKNKQKQKQKTINSDNQEPTINVFAKQDGSNAIISGRVTDNTEVAEVLVDGEAQQIKSNGTFETPFYIPRTGKTIEIVAFDVKGNKASKFIKLERDNIQQANIQQFKSLNPSIKKVRNNPNALALIIGISDYENTKASALYADSDAKTFYDYANMKLGIPSSNIRELIGNNAERLDIVKSVRNFLLKRTITDKTDIYVFFAGHGLATDDGKGMYLLPYDGDPDYLEDSAIQRKELFSDIQATKPRSVTVFLDTCYSGGTRNEEETLVASLRPIIITAKEQSVPDNFTVLSAAKGNQTSQSLEEVKHGLFSYYTMLGMEGGADTNNDNKITARELHAFIKDKVERQSQFRQTPELQGDKDRVLVQFN